MKGIDLFIEGLKQKCYVHKEWLFSMMTAVAGGLPTSNVNGYTWDPNIDYVYRLYMNQEGALYYVTPEKTLAAVTDHTVGTALCKHTQVFTLPANTLSNQKEAIETSVGNAVANAVVLCYPFGDIFPYMNRRFGDWVDDLVASKVDVKNMDPPDPTKVYASHIRKYSETLTMLFGMTQICVPSATERSMLPNLEILKIRDKMIAESPKPITEQRNVEIKRELERLDRESLKDDPTSGYYLKSKHWGISRMQTLLFYGSEAGFGGVGDETKMITTSIDEGLDYDNLPTLMDAQRATSFSRGALTALGGAKFKYLTRIFQNTKIEMEDCGTVVGERWLIHPLTIKQLTKRYAFDPSTKKTFMLTTDWLKQNMGQLVTVRSPKYCKVDHPSFCMHCLDEYKSIRPTAVFLEPAMPASVMQNDAMKAMHGRASRSLPIELKLALC